MLQYEGLQLSIISLAINLLIISYFPKIFRFRTFIYLILSGSIVKIVGDEFDRWQLMKSLFNHCSSDVMGTFVAISVLWVDLHEQYVRMDQRENNKLLNIR